MGLMMNHRRLAIGMVLTLILIVPLVTYAQSAKLTFILGQVEVRRGNQNPWQAVKREQEVAQGDSIRTGREARAELTFEDGSVVRMGEKGWYVVQELTGSGMKQRRGLKLLIGKIWTSVKSLLSVQATLKIESPTTIAAVRGTTYRMDVGEDATTEIRVYDGQVQVTLAPVDEQGQAQPPRKSGQIQGPRQIPGPREVTMSEWIEIVEAMQRIVVKPDGTRQKSDFSVAEETNDEWVQWNKARDAELEQP